MSFRSHQSFFQLHVHLAIFLCNFHLKVLFGRAVVVLIALTQVAVVANNRSMNELPKVEGLLSYRSDDRKLYLKENSQWKALAKQKEVKCNVCSNYGF